MKPLIPAIIAERNNVFSALADAWRSVHEDDRKSRWLDWFASTPSRRMALKEPFLRPYLNVIRMHLLIFFFAFCRHSCRASLKASSSRASSAITWENILISS